MGLGDSIRRLSKTLGFGKSENEASDVNDEDSFNLDLNRLQESDSDSEIEAHPLEADQVAELGDIEDEEDIPLSEAEIDDDADVIPFQKTTINNTVALKQSLASIALPKAARDNFQEHMSISAAETVVLKDIYDDTERELAFYKQALAAAKEGRRELRRLKVPFSRPDDYFAEMVKSDEHMGNLKRKLVDEETAKKAAVEARRQRELKKHGKKIQHAKLQERQKEKRDTMDKISSLKRKRQGDEHVSADQFDVAVDDALSDKTEDRDSKYKLKPNYKRQTKNDKYGFGGRKRNSRQNTAESSMEIPSHKKSGGVSKRPGKSHRRH